MSISLRRSANVVPNRKPRYLLRIGEHSWHLSMKEVIKLRVDIQKAICAACPFSGEFNVFDPSAPSCDTCPAISGEQMVLPKLRRKI